MIYILPNIPAKLHKLQSKIVSDIFTFNLFFQVAFSTGYEYISLIMMKLGKI